MGEKDIKGHNVAAVTGATSSESRAKDMPEHVRWSVCSYSAGQDWYGADGGWGVLDGGHIGVTCRTGLKRPCAASMRPLTTCLLYTLIDCLLLVSMLQLRLNTSISQVSHRLSELMKLVLPPSHLCLSSASIKLPIQVPLPAMSFTFTTQRICNIYYYYCLIPLLFNYA